MFLQGFILTSTFVLSLVNGGVKVATLTQPTQPAIVLTAPVEQVVPLKPVRVNGIELKPAQPTIVTTFTEPTSTIL